MKTEKSSAAVVTDKMIALAGKAGLRFVGVVLMRPPRGKKISAMVVSHICAKHPDCTAADYNQAIHAIAHAQQDLLGEVIAARQEADSEVSGKPKRRAR